MSAGAARRRPAAKHATSSPAELASPRDRSAAAAPHVKADRVSARLRDLTATAFATICKSTGTTAGRVAIDAARASHVAPASVAFPAATASARQEAPLRIAVARSALTSRPILTIAAPAATRAAPAKRVRTASAAARDASLPRSAWLGRRGICAAPAGCPAFAVLSGRSATAGKRVLHALLRAARAGARPTKRAAATEATASVSPGLGTKEDSARTASHVSVVAGHQFARRTRTAPSTTRLASGAASSWATARAAMAGWGALLLAHPNVSSHRAGTQPARWLAAAIAGAGTGDAVAILDA